MHGLPAFFFDAGGKRKNPPGDCPSRELRSRGTYPLSCIPSVEDDPWWDLGWGTKRSTTKRIHILLIEQGVLDQGPQIMPTGLGLSPTFCSYYTLLAFISTGGSWQLQA